MSVSENRLMMFPSRSVFELNSPAAHQRHDFDSVARLNHARGMSRSRYELLIPLNRQIPRQQLQLLKQLGD